jgi:predicted HTH transcriptional regulator
MPGVTVEDVLSGVSVIRNPTIARAYREMGLIEQWGTGIPSVVEDLAERGLPAPAIEENPGRLVVTIPIPLHRPSIEPRPGTVRGGGEQVSEQVESPSNQVDALSNQVDALGSARAILTTARDAGEATRAELLIAAGVTNQTRMARRHIQPLIEDGLLALTIPAFPTSSKQRYVITAAGRDALDG